MAILPIHSITFTGGDVVKFSMQVKDKSAANPTVRVIRDLTGWTATSQVRQTPTSEEVLATWTITNEPLGTDGTIHMKLLGTETQAWSALKNVISDVQLTDPAGDPTTILRIELTVNQDVTRE